MVSFKYWDDCVDPREIEALWKDTNVRAEWISAGETKGQPVHLSRDPDGQPYLTQIEMKAVVDIIVNRHFYPDIDPDMVRAIAELESDRQPTASRYNKKTKETTLGIMQLLPQTAEFLVGECDFRIYAVEGNPKLLYRPFVNVYLGTAYLKWLSNHDNTPRSEEYMVRAYRGGVKKATHKSTLEYWKRYQSVKESLPLRKISEGVPTQPSTSASPVPQMSGEDDSRITWDSKASPQDMDDMWNHPIIGKEWTKAGEKKGKVRLSHDAEDKAYITRPELKAIESDDYTTIASSSRQATNRLQIIDLSFSMSAECARNCAVADIILFRHFSKKAVMPGVLCALAEIVSMRLLQGVGPRPGLLGIDFPTACWLYKDLNYKAYKVESMDDLTQPFVSMYFGASYLDWLSQYEGSERSPQFVVQAYLSGPKNANLEEKGPLWQKFEETLRKFEDSKKGHGQGSCVIL